MKISIFFPNFIFSHSDPAVQALQFLDVISMKDPSQKSQFFRTTLTEVFPFIPRVSFCQETNAAVEKLTNKAAFTEGNKAGCVWANSDKVTSYEFKIWAN